MAKTFTYQVRIGSDYVSQDTAKIGKLIQTDFQSFSVQLPELKASDVAQSLSGFEDFAKLDLTKPLDQLQIELKDTEAELKRLDAQLQETFIKGGLPKHTQEYNNLLKDYQAQQKANFGSSGQNIRIGDLRKEFVNDTAAAADIGRSQSSVKELQEKIKFTAAEQRQQLELEIQIESERYKGIQLQRAISEQEYNQLHEQLATLSQSDLDNGGRELLNSAYQEYEATSKRLIEEELQAVRALSDRKQRIAALEQQAQSKTAPASERVTALTVTKASVDNAEKLTEALKEAAAAQDRLADATKRTASARNDSGLQSERERLELQRRSAQIAQQLVEQEKSAGAERRAEIEKEIIARREAVNVSSQIARTEANERTSAARAAQAQLVEAEKRTTADFVEEQKRRTAEFRAQLKEQEALARKNEAEQRRLTAAGGNGGGLLRRVDGIANLLTGGLQAYATVQLVRQLSNVTNELDRLRVEASRSKVSLDILSGSSSNAAARIAAIQSAGNGTINTLNAIQIAVQSTALGLANTTGEFERLTTAARAVTLVSPVIKDINGALAEISLAGANQSFRRLDQLGLGVTEVKDKIRELQAADKSLSDQQAFSAAVIDTLNSKYGALLQTTEAQASGQEQLATAFADFKTALSDTAPIKAYDDALAFMAKRFKEFQALVTGDFKPLGNIGAIKAELDRLKADSESLLKVIKDNTPTDADILAGVAKDPAKAAEAQIQIDINERKAEQLTKLSELTDKVNKLQEKGVIVAGSYAQTLAQLAGEITRQNEASKEQIDTIQEFSKVADALSQITSGNSQASRAYLKAQEDLGDAFIGQNDDAKKLLESLVLLDVEFNSGKLTQSQYKASVNSITQALAGLTNSAKDYQKAAEAQKRANLLSDAESGLVQAVENEAQKLIETTGKYDEVKKNLEEQKQFIADEIAKIPTDINPDEIPLIVARIKFQIDNKYLQNLDAGGSGALINTAVLKEFNNAAAEKNKEARELIRDAKRDLLKTTQDRIVGLIADGLDPKVAERQIEIYSKSIEKFFAEIPKNIDPTQLDIALAEYNARIERGLQGIAGRVDRTDINPAESLDSILVALDQIGTAAADTTPGISSARDGLLDLYDVIQSQGFVTKDQADELERLTGIAYAVGDATGNFANEAADLGDEFFNAHSEAGALFDAIAQLEGKYVDGKIPLDEYKGAMLSLIDRLIELAEQAGVTGKELEDLLGLKSKLTADGLVLGLGFQDGRANGQQEADKVRLQNAEATQRENERAADRAAKAFERAAERAARAFEGKLDKVSGLFGTSSVTQDQLDLAAAGIPQNFADDFVRRLRDVVVNGKQRSDVSLQDAIDALANIGVDATGMTPEMILKRIEQAWNDSSLFSNPENLKLINTDAVQSSLDMQKKAEEGRQNIIDYLKKTFDVNLAALTGGGTTGTAGGGQVNAPTPEQLQGVSAQSSLVLDLTVDSEKTQKLATDTAQQFAIAFSNYDFSPLILAPVDQMESALADSKISERIEGLGASFANKLRNGFRGEATGEAWITDVVEAVETTVTRNVLEALSS